uniref:Poly [ADP-ribose] polymerase n=1 Tax=Labrus bergylta TaxID=56723 RepID=A0A3Q3L7J4_9LABR
HCHGALEQGTNPPALIQDFTSVKVSERERDIDVLTLKEMESEKQTAIIGFLTTPIERETIIPMEPDMLKYIQNHCHQLMADMDQVSIFPLEAEDVCGLKIHGPAIACQMAEEVLQGIVSSTLTKTITFSAPGITRFLVVEDCKSILEEMQRKFQVYINIQIVSAIDERPQEAVSNSDTVNDVDEEDLYTAEAPTTPADQDQGLMVVDAPLLSPEENATGGCPQLNDDDEALGRSMELEEEAQLSLAIQYSMETSHWSVEDEEEQLQRALELSKTMVQHEVSSSSTDKSPKVGKISKNMNTVIQDAMKAASTIHLHVFAAYTSDLSRVEIAFGKKVSLRQVEERVEHRALRKLSKYHRNCLDKVDEDSDEFQNVIKSFYETIQEYHSKIRIIKVEKLMNRLLYNQYKLKKASVLQRATYPVIERTLYHGTSETSVKEICVHGFNRSFCGKNATVYGQGVYFAVNSGLSVQDQYSPPNADGHKFIFVSKVLTGDYTKGCHSMKTAPLKETGDIPLRYESVTDDITKPSMFVIFNDTQAFPEYLITCQRIHR